MHSGVRSGSSTAAELRGRHGGTCSDSGRIADVGQIVAVVEGQPCQRAAGAPQTSGPLSSPCAIANIIKYLDEKPVTGANFRARSFGLGWGGADKGGEGLDWGAG